MVAYPKVLSSPVQTVFVRSKSHSTSSTFLTSSLSQPFTPPPTPSEACTNPHRFLPSVLFAPPNPRCHNSIPSHGNLQASQAPIADQEPWTRTPGAYTPQDCEPAWAYVSTPYLTRPPSSCAALLCRHIDSCEATHMPLSKDATSSQVCTQAGQVHAHSRFHPHIC